jgi:isoleucyl-tRNA synthetase
MLQLWNTYGFYVRYANLPDRRPGADTDLDRWIRSRLADTVAVAIERLDDYDTTTAGRAIAAFVEDLSNWYIRRSRRRFWEGDETALATLRDCLLTVARLLAPLTPFVADAIYENLDGSEPSVHLCDYPEPGSRDVELETDMAVARDAIELGRAARAQAKMKVRQPLPEAVVVAAGREQESISRFQDLLLDDLNVKTVRFVSEAEELGRWELKPNYRALGPRFGKRMPQVAEAVAALDAQHAAATLRAGGAVGISIDGKEHPLTADDVQLVLQPLEGYRVERSGTHAVALNLELTPELRQEGLAREAVHAIQAARKAAGLNVEDRINLTLGGDDELLDAVRAHESYVAGETLAVSVSYDGAAGDAIAIEGRELLIRVERAA